jgi:hypothetical protein
MEVIFLATLMETAIVVILLAIVLLALQLIRDKYRKNRRGRRRTINGIEAKAIVLAIEQTGLFMNHKPQVKMQMQVIPERGRNFVAEVKEVISFMDLAAIKTGTTVRVKYNPANLKEIMLVKAA